MHAYQRISLSPYLCALLARKVAALTSRWHIQGTSQAGSSVFQGIVPAYIYFVPLSSWNSVRECAIEQRVEVWKVGEKKEQRWKVWVLLYTLDHRKSRIISLFTFCLYWSHQSGKEWSLALRHGWSARVERHFKTAEMLGTLNLCCCLFVKRTRKFCSFFLPSAKTGLVANLFSRHRCVLNCAAF